MGVEGRPFVVGGSDTHTKKPQVHRDANMQQQMRKKKCEENISHCVSKRRKKISLERKSVRSGLHECDVWLFVCAFYLN